MRLLKKPVITALRGIEIGIGLGFVSPLYQKLQALRLGAGDIPPPSVRTALVAHVYYPELWREIMEVWQALPTGSPLLVTTADGKGDLIRALGGNNPLIEIYENENRGRDILPFIRLLNTGRLDRFDAVLKIHTKKSPHLWQGNLRRRIFYTALAGHGGNVCRILRQFSDPKTGLVGPARFFRTNKLYWFKDKPLVEDICRRMEPKAPVRLGFFEGSMFWVRPQALAPLRALGLQPEDFDAEAGQLDGTLHHAIERVFTLGALAGGYETRSIAGAKLLAAQPGRREDLGLT